MILLAAKLGGDLFERFGQPAVLGELIIGMLIGNAHLIGIDMFEAFKYNVTLEVLAELGVIIRSPELSRELVENVINALPEKTYELFLDEKERLRWRTFDNGAVVIYDKEPHTSWRQRFVAGFMRLLPIRGQL